MNEQPTMEEMRRRLRAADTMAELERRIAEIHSRDCNFPSLADSDLPEEHHRFARAVMEQVRGMLDSGPLGTLRVLADARLGEHSGSTAMGVE